MSIVGKKGKHTNGISVNSSKDKTLSLLKCKVFDIITGWLPIFLKKKMIEGFVLISVTEICNFQELKKKKISPCCGFTAYAHVHAKLLQLCLNLCSHMDCSPPGTSVHGIFQARILEWVAMPSSKGFFPTQGSNLCFLHYRWILYWLSHEGSSLFHTHECKSSFS